MRIINIIAWIILLIGGLNWLLIGIFSWNFVTAIFGGVTVLETIIYILVGLSSLWLIIAPIINHGKISLWNRD